MTDTTTLTDTATITESATATPQPQMSYDELYKQFGPMSWTSRA